MSHAHLTNDLPVLESSLIPKEKTKFDKAKRPACPITGDPDCEILEEISTSLLINCYQRDLGIDVSSEFGEIKRLQLCRGRQSDLIFFYPSIVGSAAFYKRLQTLPWYSPPEKFEYDHAAPWIRSGDHVLDIGCGVGHFATRIPDAHYTGLEPQPSFRSAIAHSDAKIYSQQLTEHAVSHREFYDAVCAFQVLEHVADPVRFVESALTCLKPRGILTLGVPSAESYLTKLTNFVLNAPPHHVSWWTDQSLRCLVAQSNLDILRLDHAPIESWELRLYWMQRIASAFTKPSKKHFTTSVSRRLVNISAYLLACILETVRSAPSSADGASVVLIAQKRD